MTDSSSEDLLRELDEKQRKSRIGRPILFLGLLCSGAAAVAQLHVALVATIGIAFGVAAYLGFRRDAVAKTVVLFYAFDEPLERAYEALHESAKLMAACSGSWHIAASAHVYQQKYHAGASAIVERKETQIRRASPPFLKTNIETVSIGVGRQTLFLFPDRLLVYESGKVGAVGYGHLALTVMPTRFIEETAPADARIVDRTWRYVNKKGGPDRRFSNNRELPICLYDEVHFTSPTGLNEIIQLSRCGVADDFKLAVARLRCQIDEAGARRVAALQKFGEETLRIGRNGEDLGELSIGIVREMLSVDQLSPQDSYFDVTKNDWRPLEEITSRLFA